jgi:hypothetical protein
MLAACGGGAPSVTTPNASDCLSKSAADQAAGALPIKGHCELTFNPPPLPLPPVHRQIDTGTCWFSHLGKTALQGVQDINFAAGTQSGTRTFTAANGDVLRATTRDERAGRPRPDSLRHHHHHRRRDWPCSRTPRGR